MAGELESGVAGVARRPFFLLRFGARTGASHGAEREFGGTKDGVGRSGARTWLIDHGALVIERS